MEPRLSVVIVSWNVRGLLRRALASLEAAWAQGGESPERLEIIVVDNGSHDGTVAMVREHFPHVRLIANRENRGFTGGNNQGIRIARAPVLFLLNPDTEVVGDAPSQLLAYLDAHPRVGMVGPKLLNADGTVQSSRRRFPTLPILFLESTWLQGLARPWLRRYYVEDRPDDRIQPVDWITGAAMMVRRSVLDEVGLFDEGFFMYSEELDLCRRIRAAGWEIVYLPTAQVFHYVGKSSEQVVAARHIHFQASKVRYACKYHGAVVAEVLRRWLLAQYLWQMGVEGVKLLLGHRPDLRRERLRAYRQVLASGLREPQRKSACGSSPGRTW